MRIGKGTCEVGHFFIRLQHLADLHGNLAQTLHHLQIVEAVDGAFGLAHREGDHRQHGHLTRKSLRRGHTNLRTDVDIGTRIRRTGNAATDGIADTVDEGTMLLGQLHGGQRVGGLAALGDGNHHVTLADDRIPVAELRRILHLHRHATESFYQLLADESGVPRGSAGHDDDALGLQHLPAVVNECRKCHVVGLQVHTTTHAVRQALGLLEDFLQHEVRIAALLNLAEVDIDGLHLQFLLLAEDAQHVHLLTAADDGDVAVFEIHHLVSIFHDWTGIRAEKELVLANAHHERTLLAGGDDLVRFALVEHSDGIGADHLIERHLHSLQQRQVLLHHDDDGQVVAL